MLTEEQKAELIETLTANENTRAGQAWDGVDLQEASSQELLAFNELLTLLEPTEHGIGCPCGRKAVWNEGKKKWEHQGSPVSKTKVPSTFAELIAQGGGTQKEREVFNMMQRDYDRLHLEAFDKLTVNASDELRDHLWDKLGYKDKSLEELQTMVQLLPQQRFEAAQDLTVNSSRFGQQGMPATGAPSVINEQPLESPTIDFEPRWKRAQ